MAVFIGVDIGQRRDPTAVCVAEVERRTVGGRQEVHFVVRHLDRLPLGTPYPEIARRLGDVAGRVARRSSERPVTYVDATGVGKPVVDLLRERVLDTRIVPVFFTHGDRRSESEEEIKLGKAYLVSRLQSLLQTARVHLPETREARALAQELLDYEIRVDENANDRYGAFRVGTHDDLVTALGLAVQTDRAPVRHLSGALPRPPGW
jgi:hypothetical protein